MMQNRKLIHQRIKPHNDKHFWFWSIYFNTIYTLVEVVSHKLIKHSSIARIPGLSEQINLGLKLGSDFTQLDLCLLQNAEKTVASSHTKGNFMSSSTLSSISPANQRYLGVRLKKTTQNIISNNLEWSQTLLTNNLQNYI